MKYGALWIDEQLDSSLPINIGNDIQHYHVIVELYREMGIADSDIVPVKNSERSTHRCHDGEKMIMAINEALFSVGDDKFSKPFPLPEHIHPVFLGLSLLGRITLPKDVEDYLRKYEPIGCRDEFTMRFLRDLGIESYTFGCISITLPKRKASSTANKVYIVDVSDELLNYIPEAINQDDIVCISHSYPEELVDPDAARRYTVVENLLSNYAENARLVITARLHTVLPCIAMGIPVIYASENHSKRLAWIDKHLPIYTDWTTIDWNPSPINIDEIKQLMREVAKEAISCAAKGTKLDVAKLRKISEFWEERPLFMYEQFERDIIRKNFSNKNVSFNYIIWGAGLVGKRIYNEMRNYPHANLVLVVDSFVEGEFYGHKIHLPEEIHNTPNAVICVATYTGKDAVVAWMNEHNMVPITDYILFSTSSG